jgi:phosphatidylserine decarboxylase
MFRVRRPLVAPEGRRFVLVIAVIAVIVHVLAGWGWALPAWLLALVVMWLFRDPDREIPPAPLGVVSPADGRIISTGLVRDARLERSALAQTIRMGWGGVYVVRSPVEGKVNKIWSGNGDPGVSIWLQTDEGDDVMVTIRAAQRLLRSSCYIHAGQRVGQGQRCGLTPFGAEIDILMPEGARVETDSGSRVHAGSDLIATLVRKPT